MTSEMASKAKTMVLKLRMAQHAAAAKLGVNQGRVSDAVNGKIFPDAPFAPMSDVT
jgi:predicted XRE-type DNA-binding protein